MAYDELLSDRIANTLREKGVAFSEKKIFGGIAFMVDDKMCMGVVRDQLMARIDPDFYAEAIRFRHCSPMDFTGRPMKGYVYVAPGGLDMDEDLLFWIQKCLDFNPLAKSHKKKKQE